MKRAEWAKLVEEWRVSGQSARQFARAHGVVDTALRYWAGRLGDEVDDNAAEEREAKAAGAPRRKVARASVAMSSTPALARVVRPGEAAPMAADRRLTVTVGKVAIVVAPSFDAAHLRAVVRALSEVE